jgi:hypothetical protein
MTQQARTNRRRLGGVLIALIAAHIAAWPGVSHAAAPVPQLDSELCDGPEEPDLALPELADLGADMPDRLDRFDHAFNAAMVDNILKSVGDVTHMAGVSTSPRQPGVLDAFLVKPPASVASAPTLATLAHPTFGNHDGMAISINPRLVQSGALNTDIRISHSSEILDAGFNLATQQSLLTADPMAVRYDGRALVKFGPTLQMGVAARGSLGTLTAPTLAGNELAGPLLHINLIDSNLSLMSDMGYDFGLNPLSAAARTQFHAKLDLKLKL